MLSTDRIKNKEVINIKDGKSIGFISDIEVDLDNGKISGIIIPKESKFFSWFSKEEESYFVPWEKIRTVGDDVVLIEFDL